MIRAFPRSYGDISTLTLSPTEMRMKFLRIFPEMWARTSWPLGRATRNMVPGNTCVTEPVNSMGSSFGTLPIQQGVPQVLSTSSANVDCRREDDEAHRYSIRSRLASVFRCCGVHPFSPGQKHVDNGCEFARVPALV